MHDLAPRCKEVRCSAPSTLQCHTNSRLSLDITQWRARLGDHNQSHEESHGKIAYLLKRLEGLYHIDVLIRLIPRTTRTFNIIVHGFLVNEDITLKFIVIIHVGPSQKCQHITMIKTTMREGIEVVDNQNPKLTTTYICRNNQNNNIYEKADANDASVG